MYLLFILFFAGISGFSGICFPKRDFVFLLDESGSVGSTRFQTMKRFVCEFMEHFTIGPTANQFSVVVFNDVAREVFSLNRHFSLSDIQSAVMNIGYSSGGTSIGKGLEYARLFSFASYRGARSDSAKIVILITDGQSSISNEAQLLKDQNVTIFCIGLIKEIDEQLLRNVSTHNDYTNITDMLTTLSRIQAHVVEKSCADPGFNISTVSPVSGQIGHKVTLICNVTATYPPVASVTWEFNGARIEIQSMERFSGGSVSSPSLLITNLQHTDEGNYTCIVSNLYSSDSAVVSLDVVSFAGFNISTVSPVSGQIGHKVTLICNVTATFPPVASVTWEFNGARIETQSMERFSGGSVSSPSLLITNLQHTDEGNYTCIVSNLYSSDSAVVSLDVVSFAGFNISTVSPVSGQIGHKVTLICNVTATYPPVASVTWEFNGARIETKSMERFSGGSVSSPSLLITNLQHTDEGNYTCIVSNLYSSDSAVVSLDIVSFDVVDETTVSLVFGDFRANVTLICNVASLYSPVSSVTWERDGTRIDPQSHDRYRGGSVTTPSLFISNLNTTDQGNYSCSASNMFGSGQSYIYLMITIGSSEDPCDSCGIFYDCVLSSDVCSKSAWKVAMFSLLTLFACLLLLGAMLLCMIQKYKSRRSFEVDKKDSNANSQQWKFEVQLLSFKM